MCHDISGQFLTPKLFGLFWDIFGFALDFGFDTISEMSESYICSGHGLHGPMAFGLLMMNRRNVNYEF